MGENLLRRIKGQLNAKFYMMNDAWLRDCVEYFIEDKSIHEITDRHIFKFVEGQWHLSNLREISNENGCLPRNLAQQVSTTLTGTYILQVEKMYDITSSKYKQLCKIRKVNSDNLEITEKETEEESTGRELKGRRTMQLCLTDGVQAITAIEYVPLRHMTDTLLPGYKVMIIGPVSCRRGVILLESCKYREIGGEVESLLKPNALENVLARALGVPENPDPYHDNRPFKEQNILPESTNEDCFFDDDFEQAVDLEAVTEIERQSQEIIEVAQSYSVSTNDQEQTNGNDEMQQIAEEFLEDMDFEPLKTRESDYSKSNNLPVKALRVFPASSMEIDRFKGEDDIMIIEEASTSYDFRDRPPPFSVRSIRNENIVESRDNNFDRDGSKIIVERRKSCGWQQGKDTVKMSKIKTRSPPPTIKPNSTKNNLPMKVEDTSVAQKFMANTPNITPRTSKSKTTELPPLPSCSSKICDTLRDVLRENIVETTYRMVRGQVKSYSSLTKQGKCWTLTASIVDHTSNVEVCFDSKILERFLGFTVQEFLQKKKLAKSDSQIDNELRLSLRETQRQIENLDALFKLELVKGQVPKIVDITQMAS